MEATEKQYIKKCKKTVREINAEWFKDGFSSGLDLKFNFDASDCYFGQYDGRGITINYECGNVKNKTDVIEKLNWHLNELDAYGIK